MGRSFRQKINETTVVLSDTINQWDLIDIYRTLHSKAVEYTFFSSAQQSFSRINNMLGHKTSINKFKRIEIISSSFSYHNSMKLVINYKKKKLENKHMETKQHATNTPMCQ